ncbi:MAG TPA: hypothetical protein VFO41_12450 [Alphaproteobacteria bacterium]|nr:hypothetical protein [Alphaproteobacteria bacterium]
MTEFTDDQIRMLAECERMMDAGEVPFVRLGSGRVMMDNETMARFGLTQGQTIGTETFFAIRRFGLDQVEQKIAARKRPH